MGSRRARLQHEVRSYVGAELYERLLREAAARGLNISRCMRADLEELYAIRDEVARAVRTDPVDASSPEALVPALVAQLEKQITAGLASQDSRLARIRQGLRRIESMLDRQYLGMMLHLPDVPEELRKARSASANDRHLSWRRAVADLVRVGGPILDESHDHARKRDSQRRAATDD